MIECLYLCKMGKMYNDVVELLPELIHCFNNHLMFDSLEEEDVISFLPIEDEEVAKEFVAHTNKVLSDHFEVEDGELCYPEDSYLDKIDNPIFFWKDYLGCFFNFELVEDLLDREDIRGTSFGTYRITHIAFINEVNKWIKKRRLNGINLEYRVIPTPLDSNKHWNRTYDKEF